MKKTIITAVLVLAGLPNITMAASCKRSDLTGLWKVYSAIHTPADPDSPIRCFLRMPGKGSKITAKGSSCLIPGVASSVALTGTLKINKSCHVTGAVKIQGEPSRNLDAYISSGKDSISGMTLDPQEAGEGRPFSGVK